MDKKESENKALLYGIIGFLVGIIVTIFLARSAVNSNNMGMMSMMGMRQNQMVQNQGMMKGGEDMMGHGMGMDDMVEALKGKTGDEFDRSFISLMIEHHQGAIDMANLAKQNAKHQEIKDLANDIETAQTTEIEMMQKWQKTWGY